MLHVAWGTRTPSTIELLRILARLDEEEPGRKIILFAYYKATLALLEASSRPRRSQRVS